MLPHWKGLRSRVGSSAGSVVQVPQVICCALKASREGYLALGSGVAVVPPLLVPGDALLLGPVTPSDVQPASRAPPSTIATTDMDLLQRAPYVFMWSCVSLRPLSRITMWTPSRNT